jgi:hypothetical protein
MLTTAFVFAALTLSAANPRDEGNGDGALIDAYVQNDGFEAVDADRLANAINASLETRAGTQSALLPAADVDPLTMAVLALELQEPSLERTRLRVTRVAAGFDASPAGARSAYSFVEVTRFNLGPAVRRSLEDVYGENNLAPLKEFGDGPHTAWRLVTRPLMGNRAIIIAAGRRTMDEDDAAGEECLGQPCLSAEPGIDALAPWSAMEASDQPDAWLAPAAQTGAIPVASAADILFGDLADFEADGAPPPPVSAPEPDVEAVIENGLGQDVGVDAAYRQHGLMDDSVSAIWARAAVFVGGEVYAASAYECARGPEFAEPGAFCP